MLVKRSLTSAFTLVELIIVIIIVGILASLGLTQYEKVVEKSRTAEAKVRIGVMRNLAYQYYLENGSVDGITASDVAGESCSSNNFFEYNRWTRSSDCVLLGGYRCSSGGKSPNVPVRYYYYIEFHPSTGKTTWHCYYSGDSGTGCFGLTPQGECG